MGWQRLVKRGVHTLREREYQLLYAEPHAPLFARGDAAKVVRAAELLQRDPPSAAAAPPPAS